MNKSKKNDILRKLIEEVKRAFEAFMGASQNLRERAKAHGDALIRLRVTCVEQKIPFTGVVKELGYATSTVYNHITLAECWDRAEDVARTMGVDFELLTIQEVVTLVRPPKRRAGGSAPTESQLDLSGDPAEDGDLFAQSPAASPPGDALTRLPAAVRKLIERKKLVVVRAKRGESVRVPVGDVPVIVVAE